MMIDVNAIDDRDVVSLPVKQIRRDGATQSRDDINNNIVIEYAEKWEEGYKFPPVVVFFDGKTYWLADGFHRVIAALRAKIEVIDCEVRQGTKRDAALFSCGANAAHGLRRSPADKVRAVMRLLNDEEWCRWPDNRIAKECVVDPKFVASLRPRSIQPAAQGKTRMAIRNGVEYAVNTARPARPKKSDSALNGASPIAPVAIEAHPSRDPLREFIKTLKADDVTYRLNVKTDVGMAQVVIEDAVYHVANVYTPSAFRDAAASVMFLRWALKLKKAVVAGYFSRELEPYIEAAKANGVAVKPLG